MKRVTSTLFLYFERGIAMGTKKITDMEVKLERNYPEDSWGSKATVFGRGLREGDITKEVSSHKLQGL